jgi:hypothetical protein
VNAYKKNQRDLNIWVGEAHGTPQGNYLTVNLSTEITFQNFIKEAIDANVDERPEKNPEIIQCAGWKRQMQEAVQQDYPQFPCGVPCASPTQIFKSL